MSSKSKRRRILREHLFGRGAMAMRMLTGHEEEFYLCPICSRGFRRAALSRGYLTLEHAPPKSMGGRELVLTCRECNSKAGHTVDAAIREMQDLRDFSRALFQNDRLYRGRAVVDLGGVRTNASIDVSERGLTITIPVSQNDPQAHTNQWSFIKKAIDEGRGRDLGFRLTPRKRIRFRQTQVSTLRTAYLGAFARYGYRYALSPQLSTVRQQLCNPDQELVHSAWLLTPTLQLPSPEMFGITQPFSALGIHLDSIFVILPWFDSPSDMYDRIRNQFEEANEFVFAADVLGWPRRMELRFDVQSAAA